MDKPLRVRITLVMDVDTEAWTLDYGVTGRHAIAGDVKQYIRNLIHDGSGGLENITLVSSK
jgi:hypothetical protein